jgi:hypothetical protein
MPVTCFQVSEFVANYTGFNCPPQSIVKNILTHLAKQSKKKGEFKETLTRVYNLYKGINRNRGTQKGVDLICELTPWTALVLAWIIAKHMNTEKNMELLDEDKDKMSDGHYLTRCNRLKLAHTLREVCCLTCLNENWEYADSDSDA